MGTLSRPRDISEKIAVSRKKVPVAMDAHVNWRK